MGEKAGAAGLNKEEEAKLEALKKEYMTQYPNPLPKPKNQEAASIWKPYCAEKITRYPLLQAQLKKLLKAGNRREALWYLNALREAERRPPGLGGTVPRKLQPFLVELDGKKRLSEASLKAAALAAEEDDDEVEECIDVSGDDTECISVDGGDNDDADGTQPPDAARGSASTDADAVILLGDSDSEGDGKRKAREDDDEVVVVDDATERAGKKRRESSRQDSGGSQAPRRSGSSAAAVVDMTALDNGERDEREDKDLQLARWMAALEGVDQETMWSRVSASQHH